MDDVTRVETLRRLEPAVDEEQAVRVWRHRRAQRAKQRRIVGVAMGAAALVAAVGAGLLVAGGDSDDVVVAGDGAYTSRGQTVDFMLLAQAEFSGPGGTVRTAMNAEELENLWRDLSLEEPLPTLDFEEWIVIGVTIIDDTCTPSFEGFEVVEDVFTPHLVEAEGTCFTPNVPKSFVVALHRSAMPPRFVIRIPADRTDTAVDALVDVAMTD